MTGQRPSESHKTGRRTIGKQLLLATLGGVCSAAGKRALEWWLGWWGAD